MILVDTALQKLQAQGKPIRVGIVGAGFMCQGLTNQIENSIPGMRVAAISNRKLQRAVDVYKYSGHKDVIVASTQNKLDDAIRANKPVATEDALLLSRSGLIDVICEVTGSVEFGAHVVLEAFKHGKDVVLMNAELDATVGPILQTYAKKYGVILSACDGDEPGLQMNLYRWVKGLGSDPARDRQHQGAARPVPQSDNSEGICRAVGAKSGDGDEFRRRYQDQLRADDRGKCHRLQGPLAGHVARPRIQRRRDADRKALRHRRAALARRHHRLCRRHASDQGLCARGASRSEAAALSKSVQDG